MRIEDDTKLDFKDVLFKPKRSRLASRSEVDIKRVLNFKTTGKSINCVPIIAANMDGVGTFSMARAFAKDGNGLSVALTKHYNANQLIEFYKNDGNANIWYSMGVASKDQEKFSAVRAALPSDGPNSIDKICVDVANGYSEAFLDFVKSIRDQNPDITIMAGNVVTAEMVEALILSGVDVVKVGIGPGSVCTTRKMTGVGYPQLSAVIECADAAHGLGGMICADGGCTVPGDIAKAFGGGADFVMLGGMLAGHDQSEMELQSDDDGTQYLTFYGMSSDTAMNKHSGGVAEYRASEGKTVRIPYRGDISASLQDILGGLRSTCTYVGAARLKDLPKCTTFIRVTQQINNIFG